MRKIAKRNLALLIVSLLLISFFVVTFSSSTLESSASGDSGANRNYPITLTSPDAQQGGLFGNSVATNGKIALVGAYHESADGLSNAGRAYLFNVTTGDLMANFTSPNPEYYGYFGGSVALIGKIAVIGAFRENADGFYSAGNVYEYNLATSNLIRTFVSPNAQSNGEFGFSVAISDKIVVVGADAENSFAGSAYVFNASSGTLVATLKDPNSQSNGEFGSSVAISGNLVVVGAPGENVGGDQNNGRAYTFNAITGKLLSTLTSPHPPDHGVFGLSVALGSNSLAIVGAPYETSGGNASGFAYEFNASNGKLLKTFQIATPQGSNFFGISVAMSTNGILIGAAGENASGFGIAGRAYMFNIEGSLIHIFTSPNLQANGYFGNSVAISGRLEIVGAFGENVSENSGAGHVYIFKVR